VTDAVLGAVERADALIITGGIGPTPDDITREALCAAAGVEMRFDDDYAGRLRAYWERRGRTMPVSNLRQAEYPEGASFVVNEKGTAPGLRIRVRGAWVFALPGVPQEMLVMLDRDVIPFLLRASGSGGGALVSRVIRTWGESESRVAEVLDDLAGSANPTVAFLASSGEIKVRLTARAAGEEEAARLLDPLEAEVRRRLGDRVFAVGTDPIESLVLDLAAERGWKVATAESATGGMVAARLSSGPGASTVFVGSVVAYATEVKHSVLGVPRSVIAEHGVVSEATALGMARGAAGRLGADVVVAVSGSAGPEPLEAPVGTMVVAVVTPEGARSKLLRMPGDRERATTLTTTAALQLTRLALQGRWWSA
jgi:nicotinamide-nucleotide amidase